IFTIFFYLNGNHPALHSFPTRRSSDLDDRDRRAAGPGGDDEVNRELVDLGRCHVRRCCSATAATTAATAAATAAANIDVDCGVRSEEHTSELQSRGHLVCRLLLEKKKE